MARQTTITLVDDLDGALLPTVHAFVSADTWSASRRVVDEHPELLAAAADRSCWPGWNRRPGKTGGTTSPTCSGHTGACCSDAARWARSRLSAEMARGGDDPSAADVERMLRESLDELTENGAPSRPASRVRAQATLFFSTATGQRVP